jgi:hypothetical protein
VKIAGIRVMKIILPPLPNPPLQQKALEGRELDPEVD